MIIQSNLKTLQKTRLLLSNLTNEELCDNSVSPYYSSLGCHIRHILDFYDCVLNINSNKQIEATTFFLPFSGTFNYERDSFRPRAPGDQALRC